MNGPSPLTDIPQSDPEDCRLVARARAGESEALEELVRRHQAWIYNIAMRMLYHPQDAQDATQEILIKVLTHLSSFEGRSTFRTWLYRIVVRHVLNTKRGHLEPAMLSFSCAVGAELLEISRGNFRQRLARARRDLHNFMNDKCGLVNQANPCRCAKKTRGFIQAGYVDPRSLLFARARVQQVRDVVPRAHEALMTLDDRCAEAYREHPFHESPDFVQALMRLVADPDFHRATGLP